MKICPVCEASAFDDAEVCYGCLHRFTEKDAERAQVAALESEVAAEAGDAVGMPNAVEGSAAIGVEGEPAPGSVAAFEPEPESDSDFNAGSSSASGFAPAHASASVRPFAPAHAASSVVTEIPLGLPAFKIIFTPSMEPQGALSWTCSVEA